MGNNAELKLIRGQIRQIVKEMLPKVLTEEILESIQKNLSRQLYEGLAKIDERQKELQSYIVRNVNVPDAPKKD